MAEFAQSGYRSAGMADDPKAALGNRIRECRKAEGLTLAEVRERLLAAGLEKGSSIQHLSQVERGAAWPGPSLVHNLDSILKTKNEFLALLRQAKVPSAAQTGPLSVTGHLFFPLYLGTQALAEAQMSPHTNGPLDFLPRLGRLPSNHDSVTIQMFPFGVIVVHEIHELADVTLPAIARWRQEQIARCSTAAHSRLSEMYPELVQTDHDPYCFSAFVFNSMPWADEATRKRATHVLSLPNVLLAGQEDDEHTDELLRSTEPLEDVTDFSLTGAHHGAASWAAVAICPLPESEIDIAHDLVDVEVQLQAFWCYASNVESLGKFSDDAFGERFLRQALGRLQRPWPTEHTGTRRLREALLKTSRITEMVTSAVEAARYGGKEA